MYKVFINDSYINFTSNGETSSLLLEENFLENPLSVVQAIAKNSSIQHLTFVDNAVEKVWLNFVKAFSVVEAAGGIVRNENDETLLIKRLGKWDLPKGKMEKGETKKESAVREVMEECSIPEPEIIQILPTTYHYYALRDKHILKPTYWYLMQVGGVPELAPQTEEGITEVLWANDAKVKQAMENTYASIAWLLANVLK